MKFSFPIVTFFLFIFFISHSQKKVVTLEYNGKKIPTRIITPRNYDTNKVYPVLIGPGLDRGDLDMGCRYFGEDAGKYGWILVESSIHLENREAVELLLKYLETNYKTGKIYILGFSANSVDAFNIASIYNERIHGIIGMPGNPKEKNIERHKDQRILMIVGERDVYWKNRAEKAKRELDKREFQNKLIIVPNGGHILDELTGKPLFDILNRELNK